MNPDRKTVDDFFRKHGFNIPEEEPTTTAADRAWCEFLDVLTGRSPSEFAQLALQDEMLPCPNCEGGGCSSCLPDPDEFDDAENWRDGTMREGVWRARRER